jgi:hypothetical protein
MLALYKSSLHAEFLFDSLNYCLLSIKNFPFKRMGFSNMELAINGFSCLFLSTYVWKCTPETCLVICESWDSDIAGILHFTGCDYVSFHFYCCNHTRWHKYHKLGNIYSCVSAWFKCPYIIIDGTALAIFGRNWSLFKN